MVKLMAGFPGSPVQARLFALLWYWLGWPRLPRLAWSSQAICSVIVLAGLAAASPDFYRLASPAYGQLTEAFEPGFDPGLTRLLMQGDFYLSNQKSHSHSDKFNCLLCTWFTLLCDCMCNSVTKHLCSQVYPHS